MQQVKLTLFYTGRFCEIFRGHSEPTRVCSRTSSRSVHPFLHLTRVPNTQTHCTHTTLHRCWRCVPNVTSGQRILTKGRIASYALPLWTSLQPRVAASVCCLHSLMHLNGGNNPQNAPFPLGFLGPTRIQPNTIRYDTRCYFNVRSKANMSQLNLPHGTDN